MEKITLTHYNQKTKKEYLEKYLLSYAKKQKINQKLEQKKLEKLKKFPKLYILSNKFQKQQKKIRKTLQFQKRKIKKSNIYQLLADIFISFKLTFKNYSIHSVAAILISLLIFSGTYWTYDQIFKDLPSPYDLTKKEQSVSTKILDRNGEILYRIYEDENRTIIPLSEIPKNLINATIAIEDKDFYNHHGFSIRGISRAIISNIKGEDLQGGSTLTQQLVKNRLLSSKRTFSRKFKELLLAILVEGVYTKDEIIEMYLNQVAYGGSTYGIEEAAQKYFDKSANKLSLAESAMLAGLPAAPSVYTPFGANPELALNRQEEVLRRMVEDGYILESSAEKAKKQDLVFNTSKIEIEAPHFVMYVKKILAQQYGEDILNNGGLEVKTSLDLDTQKKVEKIVYDEIQSLQKLRVGNGAAMVTNPQTGEILAMVGSADYFDFENDGQVNVTLRPRQPGSSIKPINYALSLSNGKTPSTIINDSSITYHTLGSKPYTPKNYDGKYHGNVTIREALASSYNIPAVKSLAENGVSNMLDLGEEMGISTWKDRSRFGLSLTLGGGEVTMLDMTEVYGTFATGGWHVTTNPILEVKDYKGNIYYQNKCALENKDCKESQVLSEDVAFLISDILSDNEARTPAFGPISTLNIPNQQVAVKTGTTNNLRDNWTFGYTTNRLVSVWVGNNNNTPMSYVASGITGASPIWNKIMRTQLSDLFPHRFQVPTNVVKLPICITSGTLPCTGCPKVREEYFIKGTEPKTKCTIIADPNKMPSRKPDSNQRGQILNGISF
ncbi:MAG: PBP1A family penicillin-binding protein [Pseudomonadales bacterium]|nr:PBP1A family penicillin-binding protein [Pseudomonadales bacterium]